MGILPPDLGGPSNLQGNLLNDIRLASESSARKRSKLWIFPDYHLEYDKTYEQMSHAELMFGMSCVINELLEGKSPDPRINAKTYAKHMMYVAERGLCKNYKPGTLNRYEHKVTTKVVEGKLFEFVSAEHDAMGSCLGADRMCSDAEMQRLQQPAQRGQRGGQRGGRRGGQNRGGYVPLDTCIKWNYTTCDWQNCIKLHICEVCRGQHRARSCTAGAPASYGYSQNGMVSYGPPQGGPPTGGQGQRA